MTKPLAMMQRLLSHMRRHPCISRLLLCNDFILKQHFFFSFFFYVHSTLLSQCKFPTLGQTKNVLSHLKHLETMIASWIKCPNVSKILVNTWLDQVVQIFSCNVREWRPWIGILKTCLSPCCWFRFLSFSILSSLQHYPHGVHQWWCHPLWIQEVMCYFLLTNPINGSFSFSQSSRTLKLRLSKPQES